MLVAGRGTLGAATLPLLTPQSPEALLLLESTRIVLPACQATGEGLGHAPFRVRDAARERIFSARERVDRAPSLGMP